MKALLLGLVAACLIFSAVPSAFAAPTAPTFTTLTTALSNTDTAVVLGSSTGFAISTTATDGARYALIDSELVKITAIPVSGTLTVVRHQDGTAAVAHAAGAYVVFGVLASKGWDPTATGSPTFGNFLDKGTVPAGACSRASQQYAPLFLIGSASPGNAYPGNSASLDCIGGRWVRGDWPVPVNVVAIKRCTVPIGGDGAIISDLTAYGTDAVRVAGTIFVGSIEVPRTGVVTALSSLTGTTSPTVDLQLFALYDSAPGTTAATAIAWTALAGHAAATADIFYTQNLTTPAIVVGPARYFLAFQDDTATTTIQMVPSAGGRNSLVGNSRTGTFGTLAAITVPTTLTTSTAPIMCMDGVN